MGLLCCPQGTGQLAQSTTAPTTWVAVSQHGGILAGDMAGALATIKHTRSQVAIDTAVVDAGAVRFSKLETVGGAFNVQSNTNLNVLEAPKLQSVATTLSITGNDGLKKLEFPELQTIKSSMTISHNYDLVRGLPAHDATPVWPVSCAGCPYVRAWGK